MNVIEDFVSMWKNPVDEDRDLLFVLDFFLTLY
jgi:hypothetical protein